MNPELDLGIDRVIRAPRKHVWDAWTDPAKLAQWIPAPTRCRVEQLDVRPGGAFVTQLSDDGEVFVPHLDACFLVVDEYQRIVFTNAIDSAWRRESTGLDRTRGCSVGDPPANRSPLSMDRCRR